MLRRIASKRRGYEVIIVFNNRRIIKINPLPEEGFISEIIDSISLVLSLFFFWPQVIKIYCAKKIYKKDMPATKIIINTFDQRGKPIRAYEESIPEGYPPQKFSEVLGKLYGEIESNYFRKRIDDLISGKDKLFK